MAGRFLHLLHGRIAGPLVVGGAPSAYGWKLFMEAQALINVPSTEK